MLALRHFVPLQTLLLAIYARLFSLASHLLDVLGSDVIRPQIPPTKLAMTSAPLVMTEAPEIGERENSHTTACDTSRALASHRRKSYTSIGKANTGEAGHPNPGDHAEEEEETEED
jgi:hypothetical protein